MLKQRVLTAIVLVAVLLGVMLGLPPIATVWLVTVLVLDRRLGVGRASSATAAPRLARRSRAGRRVALIACLYFYCTVAGFVRVVDDRRDGCGGSSRSCGSASHRRA